ncbi:MAG: YCF48-related protein [Pyrinomonadaceae bacterium]
MENYITAPLTGRRSLMGLCFQGRRAGRLPLATLLRAFGPHRAVFTVAFFLLVTVHCSLPTASAAWSRQQSGTMAWLHAVYFLNQNTGWVAGSNGTLLFTNDGGGSWHKMRRPTEDALRDVYFSDEQNGWLVCDREVFELKTNDEPQTYLLRTTDGGATWRRIDLSDAHTRVVRAVFRGQGRGWTFGEAGALYATNDGGASWVRQTLPTKHLLLGGAFMDDSHGWLVGAGATILQTSDGGETWRSGLVRGEQHLRFTAASFVESRLGWAVGAEGQVFATTDGGRIWFPQASGVSADLLDVKFVNAAEGWATGAEGTLLRTTDGGAHWASERSGTALPLERICFTDRGHGWAVGFGGTIISYSSGSSFPPAPQLNQRTAR